MAGRKGSRLMEFLLPEDVRTITLQTSVEHDITLNHALSLIVREWQSNKENQRFLSTSESLNLGKTVHFLQNIEQRCEVTECNTSDKPRRRFKRK